MKPAGARNAAFFKQQDKEAGAAAVSGNKAITQRCKAARKNGFLNLSSHHLTALPDCVFGEPELEADEKYWEMEPMTKADLSFNQLAVLPKNICNAQDLVTLIIRSNDLVDLPVELFDCTKLRHLDVSSNKLQKFFSQMFGTEADAIAAGIIGIGKLVELRELHLADNQLTAVPATLQSCNNLSVLDMSRNRLTSLPAFLFDSSAFPRLKAVNMSENMIASISHCGVGDGSSSGGGSSSIPSRRQAASASAAPDIMTISMPCLESLDLHRNQLTTAPGGSMTGIVFYECPQLTYLNMDENRLTHVPCFVECTRLSRVHLSHNRLRSFDCTPLHGVSTSLFGPECCLNLPLVELHVNNNNIKIIPDEIVYCLSLKVLDVSNNDIGDVNCALGYMKALQRIALEGNPIKTIRRTVLTESTVNLKAYLKTRCSDANLILHFESIQNANEDSCVRNSLFSDVADVPGATVGGAGGGGVAAEGSAVAQYQQQQQDAAVMQRARDITGSTLDLSNMQLTQFPDYVIPSLFRCEAITSSIQNNRTTVGGARGGGAGATNAGRRYAANTNKQSTHAFGGGGGFHAEEDAAKVLCINEIDLSRNKLNQLPANLHSLSGGEADSSQGAFGGGRDGSASEQNGITKLNLSHNHLGKYQAPKASMRIGRGAATGTTGKHEPLLPVTLPYHLEHLDVSSNDMTDEDMRAVLMSFDTTGGAPMPLRYLVANNNKLKKLLPENNIPANIGNRPRMSDLVPFFMQLKFLREIQMTHNSITTLRDVDFSYLATHLEIVNLSDNKLVDIGNLWAATQLNTIILDNNELQQIPPELCGLKKLSSLSLFGNPQKGIRFAILQKGAEAILSHLRNKLIADADYDNASFDRPVQAFAAPPAQEQEHEQYRIHSGSQRLPEGHVGWGRQEIMPPTSPVQQQQYQQRDVGQFRGGHDGGYGGRGGAARGGLGGDESMVAGDRGGYMGGAGNLGNGYEQQQQQQQQQPRQAGRVVRASHAANPAPSHAPAPAPIAAAAPTVASDSFNLDAMGNHLLLEEAKKDVQELTDILSNMASSLSKARTMELKKELAKKRALLLRLTKT